MYICKSIVADAINNTNQNLIVSRDRDLESYKVFYLTNETNKKKGI